jgi:CDP-diacylglycerol--serine O-phosphatidyltransferase
LTYLWGLQDLGRSGWLVPLYYLVCASTRLARFNVQTHASDSRDFVGLPTPAAAGTIAALLFFAPERRWETIAEAVVIAALVLTGSLMVSTFRYWSPKRIDLRRRWSYRMALPLAALLLLVAYHPPAFFLSAALLYTSSAPLSWTFRKIRLLWRERDSSERSTAGKTDR